MYSCCNIHSRFKENLVPDYNPVWQNILNSPRINELFEGIEQAEKDIENGNEGQDFDQYFKELFNKINL